MIKSTGKYGFDFIMGGNVLIITLEMDVSLFGCHLFFYDKTLGFEDIDGKSYTIKGVAIPGSMWKKYKKLAGFSS